MAGGLSNQKERMEETIKTSKMSVESMEQKVSEIMTENDRLEKRYNSLLSKKLSWKERLSGKIIEI
jgi:hypothetical protein